MVRRNGAANVHELPTIHCPLFTIFLGGYMRVGIATDHGGFWLKEDLLARLAAAGHEVVDFGANRLDSGDDYPDFVTPLARDFVEAFLAAEFSQAERHLRRLAKVASLETKTNSERSRP